MVGWILKKIRNNRGFTLIELILVIGVLVIISSIAVPRFLDVQKQAKEDADYATGAMIAKAAELYEAKNDNVEDTTADVLIQAGYINGITFKSDKFKDCGPEDLTINYGVGSVEVIANTSDTSTEILYPRP
ncbi:MAG: competence type IV pilus major pilin ComGC [Sedimentibacter sp.]